MNQKGMSLREMVIVMGIIVALCLVSIPIFNQLKKNHTSLVPGTSESASSTGS